MKKILLKPAFYIHSSHFLFFLGLFLAYLGIASPMVGFGLSALGCLSAVVGALVIAVTFFTRGGKDTFLGIAKTLPLIAVLGFVVYQASLYPRINDVATVTDAIPQFPSSLPGGEEKAPAKKYTEEHKNAIALGYPNLSGYISTYPDFRVFEAAIEVLNSHPSVEIKVASKDKNYIYYTQNSSVYKFVDDVAIQISSSSDGGATLQMRSRSRDGQSDFGANAKRIEQFKVLLARKLDESET